MRPLAQASQSHEHIGLKLEDPTELLGERDSISLDRPRKASRATDALAFRQKCLASFQRGLSARALDRDTRDVRRVRDELLMIFRRTGGSALIDAHSTKNVAFL